MDDAENDRPLGRARLSKTPSWIMLGFVLGALAVLSWSQAEKPAVAKAPPEPPPVKLERPLFTAIEAVFADYGQHAIWHHDVTEVALWDTDKRAYAIFYEVLRNGDSYYFRSIPKLTRPVLTHGVPRDSPLLFTETEASRREWMQHGQFESSNPTPATTP